MAEMLKEELKPSTLNIILITFKGTDRRFDVHLGPFETLWGDLWEGDVEERGGGDELLGTQEQGCVWSQEQLWSFLGRRSAKTGSSDEGNFKSILHKLISLCQLRELFGLTFEVPVIFVDPVLKVRFMTNFRFSFLLRFSIHLNTIYGELWSPEKKTSSSTRHRPCGS